jgi:tetratricopeptide (TPR) repeat protein
VPPFVKTRSRDAWFVIRGYTYQIDLTILRWLSLKENQALLLESGEDIDIVTTALNDSTDEVDRQLEQVKHLDRPITLRSPECRIAIANAISHFNANPSLSLVVRFVTNAQVATERPALFNDRRAGIRIWEDIRQGRIVGPDRASRLNDLLMYLRQTPAPGKGIDEETWNASSAFLAKSTANDLAELIERLEWSTRHESTASISEQIIHTLHETRDLSLDEARERYPRLFLNVVQELSAAGEKRLDAAALTSLLSLPALTPADAQLLKVLSAQVFEHEGRLQELESMAQLQERAIGDISQRLAGIEFGTVSTPDLSAALAISSTVPPLVHPIVRRRPVLDEIQKAFRTHDWQAFYGTVGSGKTQLASLLGDTAMPIFYVPLRDLNENEASFVLNHVIARLSAGATSDAIQASGLCELSKGAVLIVDDLPRLTPGDRLSRLLQALAETLCVREQKLVTLSHHSIPRAVSESLGLVVFLEKAVPPFDANDLLELCEQLGAPSGLLTADVVAPLLAKTKGNPTFLMAIARGLQQKEWQKINQHIAQITALSTISELLQETMFRLLGTVASPEARELLYRLCVVLGAFGVDEARAVAAIQPMVSKPMESLQQLSGLWIEKQTDATLMVCPLISEPGAKELAVAVREQVAGALASLIVSKTSISPIEFAKATSYLRQARNGARLGLHILGGLEARVDLPIAWKRLVFFTTVTDGLLNECPLSLNLLIKARQVQLAVEIDLKIEPIVGEAARLIGLATPADRWAVVSYAAQVASLVAKVDFAEGLRLCRIVLAEFDDLIAIRRTLPGGIPPMPAGLEGTFVGAFPWFFIPPMKNVESFKSWMDLLKDQPHQRIAEIFSSSLARDGFKMAIDRLWMAEHDRTPAERDFAPIMAEYASVIAFCQKHELRLFEALAVRAQIIVLAEYMNDLKQAVERGDSFLRSAKNDDEIEFVIKDILGRQYLYANDIPHAIEELQTASDLDTGTFDGIRCRTYIELNRAVGDSAPDEALEYADRAVAIARRNSRDVPALDLVASLGEAAISATLGGKYTRAFDYFDQAYTALSRDFKETADWKLRAVVIANALGYAASMAYSGKPPTADYAVPTRGSVIAMNEVLSKWYDEHKFKDFDMVPTLLVMFANAVGKSDRAIHWATIGIEDARTKGVIISIHTLAEMLIPGAIERHDVSLASDYAFEAATALAASLIVHERGMADVRERQDVFEVLGPKPSSAWGQAEEMHVFLGVLPAILASCIDGRPQDLAQVALECANRAKGASNSSTYSVVAEAINQSLQNMSSKDLLEQGLQQVQAANRVGMCVYYLLSSFADDASLGRSIIQHAVFMEQYSTKILAGSPVWQLLTDRFVHWWKQAFARARFQFSSPATMQDKLDKVENGDRDKTIKRLFGIIAVGLKVKWPEKLQATVDWLRS